MKSMTPRERLIFKICLAAVVVAVLYKFAGGPLLAQQKSADQNIERKILFINKYYAILNQKQYYQQKESTNRQLKRELDQRFLTPAQPALAAANLQKILEEQAKRNGVNIVQVKIDKPKYVERLLAVPVQLTLRSNLKNLAHFIHLVENHPKYLLVEDLQTRRVNKSEPEHLETRLSISGFIQQLESEPKKKKKA